MEPIFPITALTKQQSEVKEAAENEIVRITEHGAAAWIFASEEAFEQYVDAAVADALYEAQLQWIIQRGMEDYTEGRVTKGTANAKERLAEMRQSQ